MPKQSNLKYSVVVDGSFLRDCQALQISQGVAFVSSGIKAWICGHNEQRKSLKEILFYFFI
jgi:hypothetical protein